MYWGEIDPAAYARYRKDAEALLAAQFGYEGPAGLEVSAEVRYDVVGQSIEVS